MAQIDSCYRCGEPATSREHVPPLCLFPEAKDFRIDLRKDLITVPSCELHNSKKSRDDEFLMISISSLFQNNLVGFLHAKTKINRALRRKHKDFLYKEIIRNPKNSIHTINGIDFPVIQGNMNTGRLFECFTNIAYGIYKHEFNQNFNGKIILFLGFTNYENPNDETLKQFIKRRFEVDETLQPLKGKNPNVFTYQFCAPDKFGLIGMKMTFYGATEIYCSYKPTDAQEPFSLGMALMKDRIHTTFTLGDEEFVFNKEG